MDITRERCTRTHERDDALASSQRATLAPMSVSCFPLPARFRAENHVQPIRTCISARVKEREPPTTKLCSGLASVAVLRFRSLLRAPTHGEIHARPMSACAREKGATDERVRARGRRYRHPRGPPRTEVYRRRYVSDPPARSPAAKKFTAQAVSTCA